MRVLSLVLLTMVGCMILGLGLMTGRGLRIAVLDVGQGDAILVETISGETVLIDGGKDTRVLQRLNEVLPFYDRRVDYVIASHAHMDHIFGLIEVMKRYDVKGLMISGVDYDSNVYRQLLEEAEMVGVKVIAGKRDALIGGVIFDFIYPLRSLNGEQVKNINNASIALRVLGEHGSMLLSGDLELEVENELVGSGLDLSADVMKAGHHGSDTSNGERFLEAVGAADIVVSAGPGNRYGHPHEVVLERAARRGMNIWRTDWQGSIELVFDEEGADIVALGKQ